MNASLKSYLILYSTLLFSFSLLAEEVEFEDEELEESLKEIEPENLPANLKWLYVADDCEASLDRFIAHFAPLGPIKNLAKELRKEADQAIEFLCDDERIKGCGYELCDTYQKKKDTFYLNKYNKILKKKESLEISLVDKARLEDKKRKLKWHEFSIEKPSVTQSNSESSGGLNNFKVVGSAKSFSSQDSSASKASSTQSSKSYRSSSKGELPYSAAGEIKKLPPKQAEFIKKLNEDKNQRLQDRIKKLRENPSKKP